MPHSSRLDLLPEEILRQVLSLAYPVEDRYSSYSWVARPLYSADLLENRYVLQCLVDDKMSSSMVRRIAREISFEHRQHEDLRDLVRDLADIKRHPPIGRAVRQLAITMDDLPYSSDCQCDPDGVAPDPLAAVFRRVHEAAPEDFPDYTHAHRKYCDGWLNWAPSMTRFLQLVPGLTYLHLEMRGAGAIPLIEGFDNNNSVVLHRLRDLSLTEPQGYGVLDTGGMLLSSAPYLVNLTLQGFYKVDAPPGLGWAADGISDVGQDAKESCEGDERKRIVLTTKPVELKNLRSLAIVGGTMLTLTSLYRLLDLVGEELQEVRACITVICVPGPGYEAPYDFRPKTESAFTSYELLNALLPRAAKITSLSLIYDVNDTTHGRRSRHARGEPTCINLLSQFTNLESLEIHSELFDNLAGNDYDHSSNGNSNGNGGGSGGDDDPDNGSRAIAPVNDMLVSAIPQSLRKLVLQCPGDISWGPPKDSDVGCRPAVLGLIRALKRGEFPNLRTIEVVMEYSASQTTFDVFTAGGTVARQVTLIAEDADNFMDESRLYPEKKAPCHSSYSDDDEYDEEYEYSQADDEEFAFYDFKHGGSEYTESGDDEY